MLGLCKQYQSHVERSEMETLSSDAVVGTLKKPFGGVKRLGNLSFLKAHLDLLNPDLSQCGRPKAAS